MKEIGNNEFSGEVQKSPESKLESKIKNIRQEMWRLCLILNEYLLSIGNKKILNRENFNINTFYSYITQASTSLLTGSKNPLYQEAMTTHAELLKLFEQLIFSYKSLGRLRKTHPTDQTYDISPKVDDWSIAFHGDMNPNGARVLSSRLPDLSQQEGDIGDDELIDMPGEKARRNKRILNIQAKLPDEEIKI